MMTTIRMTMMKATPRRGRRLRKKKMGMPLWICLLLPLETIIIMIIKIQFENNLHEKAISTQIIHYCIKAQHPRHFPPPRHSNDRATRLRSTAHTQRPHPTRHTRGHIPDHNAPQGRKVSASPKERPHQDPGESGPESYGTVQHCAGE